MCEQPKEVPLEEQLRSIPRDTRLGWDEGPGGLYRSTRWVPVGLVAHRAADELDALRAERDGLLQAVKDWNSRWADDCTALRARVATLETTLRDVADLLDEPKVPMSASVRSIAVKEMREALGLSGNKPGTPK